MITAAYTICKNEIKFVEQWLFYAKHFDYRVILDTGSEDGTWEALQEAAKTDKNLIIEQKTFTPWKFDVARNYNLAMVPDNVDWALSPDLDEYFSLNVLDEMKKTMSENPNVTNIACDRLDIYTYDVRVGPPNYQPTNKIHKRHDYRWTQPIYEHVWYKYHDTKKEVEIYNPRIYLIHTQDFKKQTRPEMYVRMLREEFETNPTNCWTLWYLLNHYFKQQDLENYVKCGLVFVTHSHVDERYTQVRGTLQHIYQSVGEVTPQQKAEILKVLAATQNKK